MSRPAVLIVEPDAERRRELGRGLAEAGYEVIPAADAAEGERFAEALGPAVIVAPAGLARFGDGSILDGLVAPAAGIDRTLVLVGESREEEKELPAEVVFLAAADLTSDELVRRLRLVLVGREIGVEADTELGSLVGDLALKPLLELVRSLHRAMITGRLQFERGAIFLDGGQVVAAQSGRVGGVKAFCRLARLSEEPFHLYLEPPSVAKEIDLHFNALTAAAIKDSLGQFPDFHTRLAVEMGDDFFRHRFTELQQEILLRANRGVTVQELLDTLSATDGAVVQELLELESRGLVVRHEPEPAVQIVTDSTADLPPELAREHGIAVVPLTVRFGGEAFRDRVDLQPREFYRKLAENPAHPVSNPPSPEAFGEVYRRVLEHSDIVSLHISRKLSLTVERAHQAAAVELRAAARNPAFRPVAVEVVDSEQVSLGLGILSLFAARLAARGKSAKAVANRLADMRQRIVVLFVVDTLEYLAKGGRIGKASAFLGGLLRIKPILALTRGEIEPVDRVMGRRAAYPRLVELVAQRIDPRRPCVVAIGHAKAPVWADRLRGMVEERFEISELIMGETGPVIGTHAGPGVVGLAAFQPTEEEAALVAPLE
jgi:DegV family protein with EDD domain